MSKTRPKFNPITGVLEMVKCEENASSNNLTCNFTAGEVISALKLVRSGLSGDVFIADTDTFDNSQAIGLALTAANLGATVEILLFGKHTDASFNFAIGSDVYLESGGSLTTVPETSGFHLRVGKVVGINTILIDIDEKIKLCI